ncbi:hypothetical protein F5B18DRAFT_598241 [Nemania serpens]|nr:hypothetical protein F5B18DRAFT_598241 [Nemania serpens]
MHTKCLLWQILFTIDHRSASVSVQQLTVTAETIIILVDATTTLVIGGHEPSAVCEYLDKRHRLWQPVPNDCMACRSLAQL